MKKQYKVGIYCRLSVDDASNSAKAKNYIPGDESTSIENQHEILSKFAADSFVSKFVMLNGWIEVKTYRDDGYSGGNFQRPGFLEMLEDARHGLINLILVKDLSRLGRDFVEVGRYTDVIFPSLGCRFVSVLDCLDSEGDNTDMLHFRSLMNDYHLKDYRRDGGKSACGYRIVTEKSDIGGNRESCDQRYGSYERDIEPDQGTGSLSGTG